MIGTVHRTDDVPAGERFAYWRDMVGRTRASDMLSAHMADYWAECRFMELGPVTVWPASFLPARFRRSPRMIRRDDPELYHLTLLVSGRMGLDLTGPGDTFGPRDLHLVDSSQPYDLRCADAEAAPQRGVAVDFPKALLPVPPRQVRELLGRALSGRQGMGAVLADFLGSLERQADTLRPRDAARLGTAVLDLVSVFLASASDMEAALPPETREQALVRRVEAFIRQRLHDPDLTPPVIAAAHHVSLSQLHRVFRQWSSQGTTVAAHIRAARLAGARADLADPAHRATPVQDIAARWGFARPSDFSRAFRAAHGVPPREYRGEALRAPD
ncbi:helix-turn-helix domain-containing protein [Streptomyces sp. NPDC051132]|uniref:helix-turn-helix domain-containing protein n=1 Tax=unclassified Streptomyces TaxID=2593676 RepID=UPI0034158D87